MSGVCQYTDAERAPPCAHAHARAREIIEEFPACHADAVAKSGALGTPYCGKSLAHARRELANWMADYN